MTGNHCSSSRKERLLKQVGCSTRSGRGQCGSVSVYSGEAVERENSLVWVSDSSFPSSGLVPDNRHVGCPNCVV
jgi:hypothetical protein